MESVLKCRFSSPGFGRLLHQPSIRFRCLFGGRSGGSAQRSRATGTGPAGKSKGKIIFSLPSSSFASCAGSMMGHLWKFLPKRMFGFWQYFIVWFKRGIRNECIFFPSSKKKMWYVRVVLPFMLFYNPRNLFPWVDGLFRHTKGSLNIQRGKTAPNIKMILLHFSSKPFLYIEKQTF